MAVKIGVDFGTRMLRLACLPNGGSRQGQPLGMPIPVWKAAGFPTEPPGGFPVKARINDTTPVKVASVNYRAYDLVVLALRFAHQEASRLLGEPVEGCVIGIPSQAGSGRRDTLRTACQEAGFRAVRLINEPMAVALSQPVEEATARRVLVYCLGAGSLEVTVIEREPGRVVELASGGLQEVSGNSFTFHLLRHLQDELFRAGGADLSAGEETFHSLWDTAEKLKERLSGQDEIHYADPEFTRDTSGRWRGLEVSLKRQEYEALIRPEIEASLQLCSELVSRAHLSGPQEIDAIWVMGGTTRTPLIRKTLTAWWGGELRRADEFAIALGAATQTTSLNFSTQPAAEPPPPAQPIQPAPAGPKSFKDYVVGGNIGDLQATFTPTVPAVEPEKDPASHHPWIVKLDEAEKARSTGQYPEALEALQVIIESCRKEQAKVYYESGKARFNTAERGLIGGSSPEEIRRKKHELYLQALNDFRKAIERDRENDGYALEAAKIQALLDHQEARNSFQEGETLEGQEKLNEALGKYKEASSKDLENSIYRKACARVLFHKALMKIDQARQSSQGKTFNPQKNQLAIIGSIKDALALLREALAYDPDDIRIKQQIDTLEKWLNINPQSSSSEGSKSSGRNRPRHR